MATKRSATRSSTATASAEPYVTRAEFQGTRDAILASQASLHADLRAVGVVLERVDGNVRGLAEGMVSMREELSAKIDGLERRLSERISVLESAVREHAAELRTLRAAVEGLRRDLEQRPDRAELVALEHRVSALEARLFTRK